MGVLQRGTLLLLGERPFKKDEFHKISAPNLAEIGYRRENFKSDKKGVLKSSGTERRSRPDKKKKKATSEARLWK